MKTAAAPPSPARVVVVDGAGGHPPRSPLALLHGALDVVAESDTAVDAADLAARTQADAVVLRLGMTELRAGDVLTSLQVAAPSARIVVFAGSQGALVDAGYLAVLLRALEHRDQAEPAPRFALDRHEGSLRDARRFVAEHCRRCHREELAEDAAVVASELVTNAIRHAGTSSELRVLCGEGVVRIEVLDHATTPPQPRPPDVRGPGGRGLHIISALSWAWGIDPLPHGKRVWAELAG